MDADPIHCGLPRAGRYWGGLCPGAAGPASAPGGRRASAGGSCGADGGGSPGSGGGVSRGGQPTGTTGESYIKGWNAKHKAPPSLYGHKFALIPAGNRYGLPAFYELHAWMWRHNSMGTFKDFNMAVSCLHSTEKYR